jgi:hypothetical protein
MLRFEDSQSRRDFIQQVGLAKGKLCSCITSEIMPDRNYKSQMICCILRKCSSKERARIEMRKQKTYGVSQGRHERSSNKVS